MFARIRSNNNRRQDVGGVLPPAEKIVRFTEKEKDRPLESTAFAIYNASRSPFQREAAAFPKATLSA